MQNDLISKGELIEDCLNQLAKFELSAFAFKNCFPYWIFYKAITEAPAVDAEPVRHGEWDEDTVPFCNVCPECGAVVERHCVKHNGSLKRCPNCGCKMDAEVE